MSRESPKSPEEIKKLISKSGYLDEQKVVVEFEKAGFFGGANYAFEDQDEHKSREVDFIATKYSDFKFGKTGFYFLAYGEVKKRSNPLVFFERKPLKRESEGVEAFIPIVATQEFFPFIDPHLRIKDILKFSEIHHQAKHEFISSQFCEIDNQKAVHKDLYEKLFVPLLKCVDSEIADIRKSTSFFRPDNPIFFLYLFQPILVICGPLYSYDVNDDSLTRKDYILYRRHYESKTVRRTILVDIVTKEHLPQYLASQLSETYQTIEASLNQQMSRIIEYCLQDRQLENQLRRLAK